MLTKNELISEIETVLEDEGITLPRRNIKDTLDALATVAQEQVAEGEDFTVPGVVRLAWAYTKARAKGEMYKKGATYTGFGGVETVAEADSKERKAAVKLRATPAPAVKKVAPASKDKAEQARFLKSRVGKAIAARKG